MLQFKPEAILAARQTCIQLHVPASVGLSQYDVESSCGKYEPAGSNNPFGIKEFDASKPRVWAKTREVINGVTSYPDQPFAKFTTLTDAFLRHAEIFHTVRAYSPAMIGWQHFHDPIMFVEQMAHIYATDPHYATVNIAVINQNLLRQYDYSAMSDDELKAFQTKYALTVDGVIGPITLAAMIKNLRVIDDQSAPMKIAA